MGRVLTFIALVALLLGAFALGYVTWTTVDTAIPPIVYVMMAIGILVTVLIGGGLMALVFYSSRRGYDEEAGRPTTDQD
jgi:hypothetical protein